MLYDISPPLTPSLKVWPGDPPLSRQVFADIQAGSTVTSSALHATVHLGAHADAPSHYSQHGTPIDQRSLDYYLGPCQVLHVPAKRRAAITPADLPAPVRAERVLLATGTYPDPTVFDEGFAGLSPELIGLLHDRGVRLVGIDTPSVDPYAASDLPAHRACLAADMAILEGLVLADVPAGVYELIALPLKLVGFDASPVRAVLRSLGGKRCQDDFVRSTLRAVPAK